MYHKKSNIAYPIAPTATRQTTVVVTITVTYVEALTRAATFSGTKNTAVVFTEAARRKEPLGISHVPEEVIHTYSRPHLGPYQSYD